jgi:hypothetical protein
MTLSGVPQLYVGAHNPASLIFSTSVFETAQITLNGVSGIALNIAETSDTALTNQGGIDMQGNMHIHSTQELGIPLSTTGSLITEGSVHINQELFVNDTVIANNDVLLGITGDTNSWKVQHVNDVLYIFKYSTVESDYELFMTLEESNC